MADLESSLATAAFTLVGALAIYALQQLLSKFLLDPVHELRKELQQIRRDLLFYEGIFEQPRQAGGPGHFKARGTLRVHAAELATKARAIPGYGLFAAARIVPRGRDIEQAHASLKALSDAVFKGNSQENMRLRTLIDKSLR